ncbi:hypothetical protein TWF506_011134 [Arthrobotrys conoides]|uniref:Uncharacterized protein n=1 Tax=Arthrobotrys conoides TaxID=74498 RepID=A0AAN8N0N0_9PEZI
MHNEGKLLSPLGLYLIVHPIIISAVQIGFQTQSQSPQNTFTFQDAWPQGRSCYFVQTNKKDPITSIKVRTSRTDIQNKKTPEAIGFFLGKKCSVEVLQFVVFYYQPFEDAVDQSFDLSELPALFRDFNHYREIKDDTLEWFNLLGDAKRYGNSLNEGDVVYQLTDGTWDTLTSVVEVTDVPTINNPSPTPYDWYLDKGLRKSTLKGGNYLSHYRIQPVTDFMRSRTADVDREEAKQLRSRSRKEWRKNTADGSQIENFKIMPSPIQMFSRSRISDAGSPYIPGPAIKGLSPLLHIATTGDENIGSEDLDASEWEEPVLEGRVSIPQMLTMNRIMPYLPRTPQASPEERKEEEEDDYEYIISEDVYPGITHSQLQSEAGDNPITAGKTGRGVNPPARRNMYSSEYYGMPLKWSIPKSSLYTVQTLREDLEEFERAPVNFMGNTGDFSRMATGAEFDNREDILKPDQESRGRIDAFAKYTGETNMQRKIPKFK